MVNINRNKVGSTHEDIDALFGIAKEHLKNVDCATPDEFKAHILKAFEHYRYPVVILEVEATLDYRAFYEPHIDPKLGGFGCELLLLVFLHARDACTYWHLYHTRARRYSADDNGYHWLQLDVSKQHSSTGAAFKKYQQDFFLDVALSPSDLPADKRPPLGTRFTPCPLLIENRCSVCVVC